MASRHGAQVGRRRQRSRRVGGALSLLRHRGAPRFGEALMLEVDAFAPRGDLSDAVSRAGRPGLLPHAVDGPCVTSIEVALADLSRQVRLEAKATVFEEGAQAEAVWKLMSGTVLLSKLLHDGRRQIIGIAMPGDFLGLCMQSANSFTASALTPVTLCRCDQARFAALLDSAPQLMRQVFATCSNELSLAQEHMLLLGRRSADEKVAAFLLSLRARWAPVHGLSARIDLPMTRQDIGDYLGLTLETVSRTMTRLAHRKIIAIIPDGVRILDMDRLKAVASL